MRGAEPQLNLTPLVDVVLVLLIIFMVAAPAAEEATRRLELPKAEHSTPSKPQEKPVSLVLTSDDTLLEGAAVPMDSLESALKSLHDAAPDRRLVVRGDRRMPYGKARAALLAAQNLGFKGVALEVVERK